jgi:hypothetical protein
MWVSVAYKGFIKNAMALRELFLKLINYIVEEKY